MFDGQFFPNQPIQFEGVPSIRHPFYRDTFYSIIQRQGLTSNLKLCLDAGDGSSYTSGQSWLDRSGNGYDFFRGTTSSAQASDPTFNGSADGRSSSEYWSTDGGDFFRYDTTNETWMQNIHKNNAQFTFVFWFYPISFGGTDNLMGNQSGSAANIGFRFRTNIFGILNFQVSNASVLACDISLGTLNAAAWNFIGFSLNEATGANGALINVNGSASTATSTYTSPNAGSATYTTEILAGGNSSGPWDSGTRIAGVIAWEGTTLTAAQLAALYQASRVRFGV